jgi:hypothetical protein
MSWDAPVAGLLIARNVLEPGDGLQFGKHSRRPFVELVHIDVMQRVLVLLARQTCADLNLNP